LIDEKPICSNGTLVIPFSAFLRQLIVALAVSKWYFTKDKSTIGSWTVFGSIVDVCYYHAGTAAYGSLLVAIVQVIRTIIARAQKKAKQAGNKIAQIVLCCCQCCFWCLECALKFINKNAYIQTAIFSTSFCKSCRQSFALIFRNAARVAAITYVSAAVLIVGKLFISSVVTVLAYYVLLESFGDQLYSVGGPITLIFLISYYVSDMFMDVLDMGISTVLHCFIADEEMFDNEEDRYHEKGLKDYVDKHGGEE
jgi:Plasma-membrane choline transporter